MIAVWAIGVCSKKTTKYLLTQFVVFVTDFSSLFFMIFWNIFLKMNKYTYYEQQTSTYIIYKNKLHYHKLIWIILYLIPPLHQFAHLREKQMSRTRTCQFIIAFLKAQFYHSSVATFIRVVIIGNSVLDHWERTSSS